MRKSILALTLLLSVAACKMETTTTTSTETAPAPEAAAVQAPMTQTAVPMPAGSTSNCLAPPFLVKPGATAYTTPKDFALTRQADANCFAWQEFISLNWVASSSMRGQPDTSIQPTAFGEPNDVRNTVWETYKESDEVFLADAKDPGPWNAWPKGGSSPTVKVLGGMKSEFDAEPVLDLSDIGQASTGHPWLTAQSGILTMYERRMNEDEYNYIWKNKLYDADVQWEFVKAPVATSTVTQTAPVGISLPDGTTNSAAYGPLGSIETKAAWLELPNSNDWPRYKTSKAVVNYPGKPPKTVTVGLVGLHIIHKTALGQQFIWATFEHKDNAPDQNQVATKQFAPSYTYYNPTCDPAKDPYKCIPNSNPTIVNGGAKNNKYEWPMQVVRETAIPTRANNNVVGLNQYAWAQIAGTNPDSVFLNYELVNVLWSNQNTTIQPGAHTPLFAGQLSPGPNQEPVSNTTLETYVQSLTCLACHASAAIAPLKEQSTTKIYDPATAGQPQTATNPYAADYSFLLNNAQQPKANKGNQ
ncbi:MAG TPA: hypothetical protein VGQ76_07380 [Thermoanaerobaculia bacterium]|nr:hypothetical protein [Thermoanaerobaculia bacterium]